MHILYSVPVPHCQLVGIQSRLRWQCLETPQVGLATTLGQTKPILLSSPRLRGEQITVDVYKYTHNDYTQYIYMQLCICTCIYCIIMEKFLCCQIFMCYIFIFKCYF